MEPLFKKGKKRLKHFKITLTTSALSKYCLCCTNELSSLAPVNDFPAGGGEVALFCGSGRPGSCFEWPEGFMSRDAKAIQGFEGAEQ